MAEMRVTGLEQVRRSFGIAAAQMDKYVEDGLAIAARNATVYAQKNHRFVSRTGAQGLEGAIEHKKAGRFRQQVFAQMGQAPYARRIHNGWGTWAPDPYLENATIGRVDEIRQDIEQGIEKGLKKAGLI